MPVVDVDRLKEQGRRFVDGVTGAIEPTPAAFMSPLMGVTAIATVR